MDIIAPLVKTGLISEQVNLLIAIPIGFLFGFALQRTGFTDAGKVARAFYFKDEDVPVVMFTAICTGMLGLWGMGFLGILDLSKIYFLPTFLAPMMVAGLLFGVGMVVGGYCPGTGIVAAATGKIDAIVFVLGFFGGSLIFGDLFPIWKNFYEADYRGVFRLNELFNISLGATIFLVVLVAIEGSLLLRRAQRYFWADRRPPIKLEPGLVTAGVLLAAFMAFFSAPALVGTPTLEPDFAPVSEQAVSGEGIEEQPTAGESQEELEEEGLGLIFEEGC